MSATLLVAYASKHGSTEEVAEAVADSLRESGFDVHVRAAREVRDLDPYAAVVLGGAIYTARWHRDARRFLHHHRRALSERPLAIFAMGPQSLDEDAVLGSRRVVEVALNEVHEVQPVTVAIFGGVVDPEKLHFPFNRMAAVDARDWAAIREWAARLPVDLRLAAGEPRARGGELRNESAAHS